MSAERSYHIASLHKNDLRELFSDDDTGRIPVKIRRKIDALSNHDMQCIASKLSDAYSDCCYWLILEAIFLDYSSAKRGGEADPSPTDRASSGAEEPTPEVDTSDSAVSYGRSMLQLKGGGQGMQTQLERPTLGHWESRVACVSAPSAYALAKSLNEFYAGKFVVGTQVFPDEDGEWTSLVYYKVKA